MNSQWLSQAELLAVHPSCTVKEMEFGKWNGKWKSVVNKERETKTSSNFFFFPCWKNRKLNLSWPISSHRPQRQDKIFLQESLEVKPIQLVSTAKLSSSKKLGGIMNWLKLVIAIQWMKPLITEMATFSHFKTVLGWVANKRDWRNKGLT